MNYQGDIIRPPSEANSVIIQVTTGCSHNKCTFCGAYRGKPFGVKGRSTIAADLEFAHRWCTRQKTVFLADGDVLGISHEDLIYILEGIRERLPWVRRVACYANCNNILGKSTEQLVQYRAMGLSRLYMGLESGHDLTLRHIAKGARSEDMVEAAARVRNAGMFLSVTTLLGIGGEKYSKDHAEATARVLNLMQPNQVAILTLIVLVNTPLYKRMRAGGFRMPDQDTLLRELRGVIDGLELDKAQLQANHASNYVVLSGRLSKDKERLLRQVDQAISGSTQLKPENLRFL